MSMSVTELVLAVLVAGQIVYQAWANLAGKKEEVNVTRDKMLDERWEREFKRMESEIHYLRQRVAVLEDHIRDHDIPLPSDDEG